MDSYNVYKDIKERTNGEIYIGVVGPVRTGKSTFIKRFTQLMILPGIENEYERKRTRDEIPQSGAGKTITTTEPKFIPKDAVECTFEQDVNIKLRLIDCVGYMVDGATGHIENNEERMVKTPWFDYEIPFSKAAEIGTDKVINEHATVGVVVTTDGSFGDIEREKYEIAEEQTVCQLKEIDKPFIVIVNSNKPYSKECKSLCEELENKYGVTVTSVNCEQLKMEDVNEIIKKLLYEFELTDINFYIPKWFDMLPVNHWFKKGILEYIGEELTGIRKIKDALSFSDFSEYNYIENIKFQNIDMASGTCDLEMKIDEEYYYEILSELTGMTIDSEYSLIDTIKTFAEQKNMYCKIADAFMQVKNCGYGIIIPDKEEIKLEEPVMYRNANKYGVRITAKAPSIHMIAADINTEISPIVGNENQAKDLIDFINESSSESENGIWETNIFGKTIEQIVDEGINNKINKLSDNTRTKMQEAIEKITNEDNNGVICIMW